MTDCFVHAIVRVRLRKDMTKKELKIKYGDNITFLFKGDEPFTLVQEDKPAGVLIEKDGKVLCYECGGWFKALTSKHFKKHNLTTTEYKIKYGFNITSGLCSKKTSSKLSDIGLKNRKYLVGERSFKPKKMTNKKLIRNSMQFKNGQKNGGVCPEQIKKRFEILLEEFGDDLSNIHINNYDPSLYHHIIKDYGNLNNAKRKFGYKINKIGGHKNYISDFDLIYKLREFVKKTEVIPGRKSRINGNMVVKKDFDYSRGCYRKRFGSWAKALQHCGIVQKKISHNKYKWILLN